MWLSKPSCLSNSSIFFRTLGLGGGEFEMEEVLPWDNFVFLGDRLKLWSCWCLSSTGLIPVPNWCCKLLGNSNVLNSVGLRASWNCKLWWSWYFGASWVSDTPPIIPSNYAGESIEFWVKICKLWGFLVLFGPMLNRSLYIYFLFSIEIFPKTGLR